MNLRVLKNLSFLLVSLILAGCGRHATGDMKIGWPPPPREPIIVYETSIYGSHNLPRGFLSKIKDFLFGKSLDMAIAKPYGLCYDGSSRLFIVDTAKKGILVFDLETGRVNFFNSLGPYGELAEPVNIKLDRIGNIYVADTKLSKIVVFDQEYQFSRFIGLEGELEGPVGLAITGTPERLFVVDTQLHEVKIYTLDGSLIGEFGRRGDQQGEFYYPLGIAISRGDTIYIVDSFHFAVQAFDLEGQYLFSFGPTPTGVSAFARPRDIAIDSEGNLYITDALNNNVKMYNSRGEPLLVIGHMGFGPGQFRLPAGIFITADDRIYVSDSINRRIQVFKYLAS